MKRGDLFPLFFFLPIIIIEGFMIIYPLLFSLYVSLFDFNVRSKIVPFIGVDNYVEALVSPSFYNAVINSVFYATVYVSASISISLALAVLLNRPFKGKRIAYTILIIPWAVSPVVNGFLWKYLLNPTTGMINSILKLLGLVSESIPWLSNSSTAMFGVIIAALWKGTPFTILILLTALKTIPLNLYESAEVDGAGLIQRFRNITVPFIMPTLFLVTLLETIWSLNIFDLIFVLTGGGPVESTTTFYLLVYRTAFTFGRIGYASATGYLANILSTIFIILYLKFYGRVEQFLGR